MGLLSFLQRSTAARAGSAGEPGSVDAARARARRRLIGAAVLVVLGVIGFPLLFDTAPRPLPVDIPIEIPGKEGLPPLVAAPAKPAAVPASSAPPEAPRPAASAPVPVEPAAPADAPKQEAPPPAAPAADAARAQAALEDRPAAAASKPAEAAGRFVVQVGAYSEAESARSARSRVEKLGLKSYTQVVETASGKRIRVRVGPYEERAEAEKAAAQLEKAGLPTAVLSL